MKEVSQYIRQSYVNALANLVVDGQKVPVREERLGTTKPAEYSIPGTGKTVKAYVIIRDQFEQPTDFNFCGIIQESSITLDVVTKYPKNSGGKLLSERISDEIQRIVNPFGNVSLSINPDFRIMSTGKELSRGLVEETETETVYRKILIYNNKINEK